MRVRPIVLCMILCFALPLFSSAQNKPKQPQKKHLPTDTVGVVNGVLVTLRDFRGQIKSVIREHMAEIKNDSVSDSLFAVCVNTAWDRLVADILVSQEIKKLKMGVSSDAAIKRILADPPEPLIKSFTDSAGFHKDAMKQFFENPGQDSLRDQVVAYYATIYEQEDFVKKIAPKAKTDAEKKAAYDAWVQKKMMHTFIDDRRVAFGFY